MKTLFITNTSLGLPELATINYFPISLAQLGVEVGIIGRTGGSDITYRTAGVRAFEIGHVQTRLYTIRKIAREFRPDVVHVFIHAGCGLYPLIMRTIPRARFVLDIRSPLLRTGVLRHLVQLKNRVEIMTYDAIGAHSIESAWTVVGKNTHIHWLPPGVALAEIPWQPVRTSTDPLRAVYVGSLQRSRKIPEMIDAVIQVNQQTEIRLDVFGYGSDIETIRAQIKGANMENKIQIKGLIPRHELYRRLSTYDLGIGYVPKQLYDAGPPLKTAEYLAAGLAVVATDTVGNRMFIEDGKNGILTGETADEFATGILRIASDLSLRCSIANLARPSVESFDWMAIVRNHLMPLYMDLLQS